MVKAGLVKHMAIMSNEKSAFYPDVPLFKEATGYDWDLQAWNMLVAPKGLDKEAQDKLTAAMKKVYASGELAEFANKQGFEVIELYGNDATQFMANEDKKFGEIIKITEETADNSRFYAYAKSSYIIIYILPIWIISYYL